MWIKRAADMLAARTFSVEQVARSVGYRSCSSFLRAFRQVHGYVPAELRVIYRTLIEDTGEVARAAAAGKPTQCDCA